MPFFQALPEQAQVLKEILAISVSHFFFLCDECYRIVQCACGIARHRTCSVTETTFCNSAPTDEHSSMHQVADISMVSTSMPSSSFCSACMFVLCCDLAILTANCFRAPSSVVEDFKKAVRAWEAESTRGSRTILVLAMIRVLNPIERRLKMI